MNDTVNTLLNAILPGSVYHQGTLSANAYPSEFITFWNSSSSDAADFDDDTVAVDYDYSVCAYSRDPDRPAVLMGEIRTALKAAGYAVEGVGYDLPVDKPDYFAKTINFSILQNYKEI